MNPEHLQDARVFCFMILTEPKTFTFRQNFEGFW